MICWGLTANIERVNVRSEQGNTSEIKNKEEAKQEKQRKKPALFHTHLMLPLWYKSLNDAD